MISPPPAGFTPCHCPEAELLRQILTGEVPAADTPMWRALVTLVEAAASRRISLLTDQDFPQSAIPTAIQRRRFPPDGDVLRWVAHTAQPCPRPPCTGITCHAVAVARREAA